MDVLIDLRIPKHRWEQSLGIDLQTIKGNTCEYDMRFDWKFARAKMMIITTTIPRGCIQFETIYIYIYYLRKSFFLLVTLFRISSALQEVAANILLESQEANGGSYRIEVTELQHLVKGIP